MAAVADMTLLQSHDDYYYYFIGVIVAYWVWFREMYIEYLMIECEWVFENKIMDHKIFVVQMMCRTYCQYYIINIFISVIASFSNA